MLSKFVQERQQSISCPFKIVIDTTPRSKIVEDNGYYKQDVELVVVKPDDLKPIHLGKYLSFSGVADLRYTELFERINREVSQYNQINSKNVSNFASELGNSSY